MQSACLCTTDFVPEVFSHIGLCISGNWIIENLCQFSLKSSHLFRNKVFNSFRLHITSRFNRFYIQLKRYVVYYTYTFIMVPFLLVLQQFPALLLLLTSLPSPKTIRCTLKVNFSIIRILHISN
jgi:hypothetical protein